MGGSREEGRKRGEKGGQGKREKRINEDLHNNYD